MDARKLDNKAPEVLFDVVKVWVADTIGRHPVDLHPPGCGWASLAEALRAARREREWQDDMAAKVANLPPRPLDAADGSARVGPRFSEQELRQLVVQAYRQQDEAALKWVATAKLNDAYSFFRRHSYGTVEQVMKHWDWYLYCLTFEAAEIKDASLADDVAASMPLDLVDLQVVSSLLNVCISVSRFQEEALRLEPSHGDGPAYCVHLVLHKGQWAPLTHEGGEALSLTGAVVELGELPGDGAMRLASNRTAVVDGYNKMLQVYMASVGRLPGEIGVTVPVERGHIKSVVYHSMLHEEAEDGNADSRWAQSRDRRGGGAAATEESLKALGLQPDSPEWAVLHDLISRMGRLRLESLQQELAGRTAAPGPAAVPGACGPVPGPSPTPQMPTRGSVLAPSWADGAASPSLPTGDAVPGRAVLDQLPTAARNEPARHDGAAPAARAENGYAHHAEASAAARPAASPKRRMYLEELRKHLGRRALWAIAPDAWSSGAEETWPISIGLGDEVRLMDVSGDLERNAWVLGATASAPSQEGWFPSDYMLLWKATVPWEPSQEDVSSCSERFLSLTEDGVYLIRQRYLEGDWRGWALGVNFGDSQPGLFPLSHLRPFVMLSRPVGPDA